MSTINKHISIPKNISSEDDLDFHFLKQKGIEYLEQLGGSLWTDFNSHDPGITILEMLSYAITDLGMRINLPMQDLLASNDNLKRLNAQFYKASEIFPTKPVTALDYRKLFVDIEGVKNCWLQPYHKTVYVNCKDDKLSYNSKQFIDVKDYNKKEFNLNGLYDILVDLDEGESINKIKRQILKKYNANRNLCEDLIRIKQVSEQNISVCASIEVEKTADEELVQAKIVLAINNYFSPSLSFYSIQEMLEKGYTPDQIFDGPILQNGFIDIEELKEAELKKEVRLSDMMKIIMNIEGVLLIKDISIGDCNNLQTEQNEWNICIANNKKPVLCDKSTFNFTKGVLPLNINKKQVTLYTAQLKEAVLKDQEKAKENKELSLPKSKSYGVTTYTTIQNDFPDTYGIGQEGLNARATTKRKAQAKQLKAYLLFFDQILANYFQHLGKVKELLSVTRNDKTLINTNSQDSCIEKPSTLKHTFFAQAIKDVQGLDELVNNYPVSNNDELTKQLLEKFDDTIGKGNEILDHLLARFAEKFGEYSFIMKTIYGNVAPNIVVENKKAFLADYKVISSERGAAFNYYKQKPENLWNTDNISGIQKRIARLMGIKNYNRRTLSKSFVEIYSLKNVEGKNVFRWRIRDTKKHIILSGTTEYTSINKANKELIFSVLQILESSEKKIRKALKVDTLNDYIIIDNFYIHKADSGKYSFHIINPEFKISSVDYIIAKQYKYYSNVNDLKIAILELICFLKDQFSEEGIFLVEHVLLRPEIEAYKSNIIESETELPEETTSFLPICTEKCNNICSIDPYSYKVTIVLPGYSIRFSNPDFRNYMETIIKEELPAHILPKICWVGHRDGYLKNAKKQDLQQLEDEKTKGLNQLRNKIDQIKEQTDLSQAEKDKLIAEINLQITKLEAIIQSQKQELIEAFKNKNNDLINFEKAYKKYLLKKTNLLQSQPEEELGNLIKAMSELNTIYPKGHLLDCKNESDEIKGKVILDQTKLGTL